eukprot:GHRR01011123.1.p1 GENE.GHRR01011123.1~~GHRR01011123.1.p1  ORF type:complete len:282 (+),score=95.71 GHRR01011123.1:128-973(+)
MGIGKAQRRRTKLVKAANEGNLHKAQFGKASAFLPLPSAPTKEDYKEHMPASLRKMLALKDAAVQLPKRHKGQEARPKGEASHPPKQEQRQQRREQQQQHHTEQNPQQQQQHNEQSSHLEAATGQQKMPFSAQQQAPDKLSAAQQPPGVIWEQPKKLKQRKKEYLKAKKLKKRKGLNNVAGQELAVDRFTFGEQVHAPPKAQLKRKHWDPAADGNAQKQQSSKPTKQKVQVQSHIKKFKRPKQLQDFTLQELREQTIEKYRAGRCPQEGQATLQTLKQLVK